MNRPVKRALISVSDKTGLVEFVGRLVAAGVEVVSSGGTAAAIRAADLPVIAVADVTGAPEMLGGRVKTLHPTIHGGILADHGKPDHQDDLRDQGIVPFELVVVNLYPFEATVAKAGVTPAEAIEKIDIGGPTLIRAAAKNHKWVAVVTSPDDYEEVAAAVEAGGLDDRLRERLAQSAFYRTAAYDAAIVGWFHRNEAMPDRLVLPLEKAADLRYGENPDQEAAIYRRRGGGGWWDQAQQLQGKAMSFNNYADTEGAWRLAGDMGTCGVAVIKHTNAAGAAIRATVSEAFAAAWACDPLAAFGGVVAANVEIDEPTAEAISEYFVEVVIAPSFSDEAIAAFATKPNVRVIIAPASQRSDLDLRRVENGMLAQEREPQPLAPDERWDEAWTVVSARKPSAEEKSDLAFSWVVSAHTKSNAIVVAANEAAVGVGAGDQSRVGAAQRAIAKAGDRSVGAVAASDAFFPFRDGVDALAAAGITAVIEPGGSMRDDEVIAAADEHDMALIFTNRRYFKH
ncbi:MAG: bifunctional phosphoribosylaminoimidazolecarboxamide formyltransferase/IMP cyclohydrolase [bacterium]|nr:bifunctional phosphoribosylaminoimidazolecarboxamide formyltransferase/IMP cyclohydrolase [bacterium]